MRLTNVASYLMTNTTTEDTTELFLTGHQKNLSCYTYRKEDNRSLSRRPGQKLDTYLALHYTWGMLNSYLPRKASLIILFLLVFTLLSYKTSAFAQETSTNNSSADPAIIKYDLAYPGILPNNPFYKLKVLRDKIMMVLVNDPYKRSDIYLLQTDKGILATAILVDENKIDLAGKTALKAENNMTLLANELYRFSQKPDASFFNKLKTASMKHQEVLNSLIKRLPLNQQETLKTVSYFSKANLQTIERFQNKKFYNKQ